MLLIYFFILSTLAPISHLAINQNNVCRTFTDYYYPNQNENCYYDPDATLETKYAKVVEVYDVITEDGYILKLFRIPRKNPRGVILLHHSIATYSHIYLWQGNDSLAIRLWRDGFDVWLANQRGTSYSNRHVNMTSSNFDYWNFSFHEMGLYDVSSELELIRDKTNGAKVIFFGHSLGSSIGLVYSTMKSEEARKYLKCMILLAAPAYFEHGTSAALSFVKFVPIFETFVTSVRLRSPLMLRPLILPLSRIALRLFPVFLYVVNVFVWAACGYTPNETDPTFFNYDAMLYGNDFSWKTLFHFAQLADTKNRFQMYDYGKSRNLEMYGQEKPPLYPLEQISVPTLLVSSYNDSLISLKDTESLFEKLPPEAKTHGHWKIPSLNHLDYHLGLHRKEIFVDRLLTFLKSI